MTSISNLSARLARLEAVQPAKGDTSMPPEIAGACLQAIAIALGGYPRPPEAVPPYRHDNISDGFARGLGYVDRVDMEMRLETDPDDWQRRIEAAETALVARYVADPEAQGTGRDPDFQLFVGVLDEIGAAKTANRPPGESYHWPSQRPQLDRAAAGIRRALSMLGITSEEQIGKACA